MGVMPLITYDSNTQAITRRQCLAWTAALAAGSTTAQTAAPDRRAAYPARPIRLVVPFPPGGPVDAVGRIVAEVLARQLHQPLVVENRAGAGGTLGTDMVAKAAPNGYTLGIGPVSSLSIAPAMGVHQPFKVETDFTMISMLGKVIGAIVAHPAAPFSDLAGLVRHAKAHPGELTFASSGIGTASHLAGAYLVQRTGIEMLHVPYKGTAPAIQDVLSGQVSVYFETSLLSAVPLVAAGRLKAIAVTGAVRSPLLPNVSTLSEQGLKGFEVSPWMALIGPAGLPVDVVSALNKAVAAGLSTAEAAGRFAALGGVTQTSSPQELRSFVAQDTARWAALLKLAGIKPE